MGANIFKYHFITPELDIKFRTIPRYLQEETRVIPDDPCCILLFSLILISIFLAKDFLIPLEIAGNTTQLIVDSLQEPPSVHHSATDSYGDDCNG